MIGLKKFLSGNLNFYNYNISQNIFKINMLILVLTFLCEFVMTRIKNLKIGHIVKLDYEVLNLVGTQKFN